jgi:hypothetical protein
MSEADGADSPKISTVLASIAFARPANLRGEETHGTIRSPVTAFRMRARSASVGATAAARLTDLSGMKTISKAESLRLCWEQASLSSARRPSKSRLNSCRPAVATCVVGGEAVAIFQLPARRVGCRLLAASGVFLVKYRRISAHFAAAAILRKHIIGAYARCHGPARLSLRRPFRPFQKHENVRLDLADGDEDVALLRHERGDVILQLRAVAAILRQEQRNEATHGPGLATVDLTNAISTGPYEPCWAWSDYLRSHRDRPGGIAYASRHDPEQLCYALFESGDVSFKAAPAVPLAERFAEIQARRHQYAKILISNAILNWRSKLGGQAWLDWPGAVE